jgi:hypothetical protein
MTGTDHQAAATPGQAGAGQADPWQVITDVMSELLRGGQNAGIRRCRAALNVLAAAGIDFDGNPAAAAAREPHAVLACPDPSQHRDVYGNPLPQPGPQPAPEMCVCGHWQAHHAFHVDVCAVVHCPCLAYTPAGQPAPGPDAGSLYAAWLRRTYPDVGPEAEAFGGEAWSAGAAAAQAAARPPELAAHDAAELATLRKLRAVAAGFADEWAGLLTTLPDDYGCEMTCAVMFVTGAPL